MPRLSDSMGEATIVAWLKQPGESFLRGEPVVEIETDKATVVYEAEADGLLAEILRPEGDTATLGEPIARLGGEDEDSPTTRTPGDSTQQPAAAYQPAPLSPVHAPTRGG